MTAEGFAEWVGPVATELRGTRAEIAEVARAVPAGAWSRPSPTEGWTYKDLLAHLAVGDWVCQTVLRSAVSGTPLDLGLFDDLHGQNERYRREREGSSVDELIAEVEAEGTETQSLLARLTDTDEDRRQEGAPASLGEYLRGFPQHDRSHTEELRTALQ